MKETIIECSRCLIGMQPVKTKKDFVIFRCPICQWAIAHDHPLIPTLTKTGELVNIAPEEMQRMGTLWLSVLHT